MANAKSRPSVVTELKDKTKASVAQLPIDVRSTSLAVLAVLGMVFFIKWARPVLIPIVTAIVLSYALTPIVRWIDRRLKVPKVVRGGGHAWRNLARAWVWSYRAAAAGA